MTSRDRLLQDPQALERYIRSQVLPRFITRLREIEDHLAEHRIGLERAYRELQQSCGEDALTFERRWRAAAHAWPFHEVNELIREHNDYYPIERRLPVDPRTGDFVTISGRSYRREPVGAAWVLERFPARAPSSSADSASSAPPDAA